jgi:hypothetical protein
VIETRTVAAAALAVALALPAVAATCAVALKRSAHKDLPAFADKLRAE